MRLTLSLSWLVVCTALVWSSGVDAKKDSRKYVDTQERFSLVMPSGWVLAPMPGDTRGMAFRKDIGEAFALMRVSVQKARRGDTNVKVAERALQPFKGEIGYRNIEASKTSVGPFEGERRRFSVYANGDKNTQRSIELVSVLAFGYVHVLHFEALEKDASRFQRDKDRFVASYVPRAGRGRYANLVGNWRSESGPALYLGEDQRFELGPLKGTFLADGGSLMLSLEDGEERYRYQLRGNALTLDSPNLETPMVYTRAGSSAFASKPERKKVKRRLMRSDVIGRWRVVDGESSDGLVMVLAQSGSIAFGGLSGRWTFKKGLLKVNSTAGQSVTYSLSRAKGGLLLEGGDLERAMRLVKE